jgi:beta-lactamase class A
MIKIPIMCGIMDRIRKGELIFDSVVTYRDSMKYDNGFTGSLKDSTKVPIGELIHVMLTLSDNTASVWLERLAGGGITINSWLEANGFHQTRVNNRTPDRQANREIYGWGQTTPREMAELLALIHEGKAVSTAASERMNRALGRSYWDHESLSQIPAHIHVLSKQGAVNQSKSEVVLVNGPSGPYVFCLITKNQQDTRWVHENEGYIILRRLSSLCLNYFEPTLHWIPVPDMEKYSP